MNWDDLKYFLAVTEAGSIRAAALLLKVNHATVSRRIRQFEQSLGQQLFERTNKGYQLTKAAEQIYEEAHYLQARIDSIARKMAGDEQNIEGDIRLTLHEGVAQPFVMEALAEFSQLYPKVDIEILDSDQYLNLNKRQADIAIRFCTHPPEHLIGRKLVNVHRAAYVSRAVAGELDFEQPLPELNWLGLSDKFRTPKGQFAQTYPHFGSRHKIFNITLQHYACRAGLGVGLLPCFIADLDPELVRLPPYESEHRFDLWLLYHPDFRKSMKIQRFAAFIRELFQRYRHLFEGQGLASSEEVLSNVE